MRNIKQFLWKNAGAIFCYGVALAAFLFFILLHQMGILILTM